MGHLPDVNELACTLGGLWVELELDESDAAYATGVIGAWASANVPGFDWETWNTAAIPNRQKGQ